MQTFVTGFQYGGRKQLIGTYVFETHGEFEPHLPPNTTLIAPPKDIPEDKEAVWTGAMWVLQAKPEEPKPIEFPMNVAPPLEIPTK